MSVETKKDNSVNITVAIIKFNNLMQKHQDDDDYNKLVHHPAVLRQQKNSKQAATGYLIETQQLAAQALNCINHLNGLFPVKWTTQLQNITPELVRNIDEFLKLTTLDEDEINLCATLKSLLETITPKATKKKTSSKKPPIDKDSSYEPPAP